MHVTCCTLHATYMYSCILRFTLETVRAQTQMHEMETETHRNECFIYDILCLYVYIYIFLYRHVHVFVGCLPFCSGAQIGSLEFQLVQGRGFEPPGQWRSDVVHSESTCLVAPAMRNSGSGVFGIEIFVKTKSDWNVSGMSQKFRLMLRNTVVISSSCLLYSW